MGGMSEDRSTTILIKISGKILEFLYLKGLIDEEYYSTLANNYKETQQKKYYYALPTELFEYMRAELPIVVYV